MIFLVSVIMYRGIVSTAMYHTGNRVLMTQVRAVLLALLGPPPPSRFLWASPEIFHTLSPDLGLHGEQNCGQFLFLLAQEKSIGGDRAGF